MDLENQNLMKHDGALKKVVSITEAARINNVTRQAIYVAIKQKKLDTLKPSITIL